MNIADDRLKYVLILLLAGLQVGGIVMVFINLRIAMFLFIGYGLALILLILLLIWERRKEKREELNYDDCDY
ncbi:hypothetical protein [Halalkalibacterium halodurans]|uniref:hypothetical protein n=1 Tax=Halalkalibacterium halodurans TaxID=86665 RepID=UPI002AAA4306|nr:hypothetical protein [Halalkalibacterium halodurans]MDY7221136.1 hypothetical protein [Halalkalibacterium halodurans]MDY7240375.1 hypothetical protein [Halalkalibacterium halodurans]MED4123596.1 hypothetical protein [Halalkalibacterium halodurans]